MTSIRLLLLSDFHQGMAGQKTLWPNVRTRFFDDLTRLAETRVPWDLVIFTGDLTQSGTPPEFAALAGNLDKLWEHLRSLGSMPRLLAIPGNHDLVRPDATIGSVRALGNWVTDAPLRDHFWKTKTNEYRTLLQRAFSPFMQWRRGDRRHIHVTDGIIPGDVATPLVRGDARLALVGLNSAFLQLGAGDFEGKLDVAYAQLQGVCGDDPPAWLSRHDLCILLTHHPASWLHKISKDNFYREIYDPSLIPVHIFGHMHEAEQKSIAFGSSDTRHHLQLPSLFGLEHWITATDERVTRTLTDTSI